MAHVLELLECPVCMETMYPPIFQCRNGHLLCSGCKSQIERCPTCREEMGDIRALGVEQIASTHDLPCRYHGMGCSLVLQYEMKKGHENQCRFRPFMCTYPCEPCEISGDIPFLVRHLQHEHQSMVRRSSEINEDFHHIFPYNNENQSFNVSIYEFDGERFCLHFEVFASPLDMVYMAFLTFMGDEADAMKFDYSLEVQKDNRQLVWKGTPRSIREGFNQIRNSHDGLVLHRSVAQLFAEINTEEELSLRVKGQIWK